MGNISIINCTPHRVTVAAEVMDGLHVYPALHGTIEAYHHSDAGPVYGLNPSGIRLAATAIASGPALGCSVRYAPSEEARAEMGRLKLIFGEQQGVRHLVIASEISCRAMADLTWDGSRATSIELMWPVLAADSLRLPMAQRWADRLATAQLNRPSRRTTEWKHVGGGSMEVTSTLDAPNPRE